MKNTIRLVPKQANNSKKQLCKVISITRNTVTRFHFDIMLYYSLGKIITTNLNKVSLLNAFSSTSYDLTIKTKSEKEAVKIAKSLFPKGTKYRWFNYINGDGNLYELANAINQ